MKVKKILKWTGIILVAGLGGALVASPELREKFLNGSKAAFEGAKDFVGLGEKKDENPAPENPAPTRENNNRGYFKPRYNNNKH